MFISERMNDIDLFQFKACLILNVKYAHEF